MMRKYGRVPIDEVIQKIHLNNLAAKRRLICDRLAEKDYETVNIIRNI